VRVDSGVEAGSEVTPMYDPMVAKLIVWDIDREHATRRMLRALDEYEVDGVTTLIPFHKALLGTEQWANGETCRDLVGDKDWLKTLAPEEQAEAAAGKADVDGEMVSRDYKVEVGGKLFEVKVIGDAVGAPAGAAAGAGAILKRPPKRERSGGGGGAAASGNDLVSPLQGNVFKVPVEEGQEVSTGDVVCVIEAMKMENEITAHKDGKIAKLAAKEGAPVNSGDLLATIE
jgi:acetyl-CoA/propionyl-CoA carboxylase biotin carboxyl carrier protein